MDMDAKLILLAAAMAFGFVVNAYEVEQLFRPERHSRGDTNIRPLQPIDEAAWVWQAGQDRWGTVFNEMNPARLNEEPSVFLRFRRDFSSVAGEPLEVDVSADERFVLFLDGREFARGPHRGLANRWHYQSYRIGALEPGAHRLEAVCWQIGPHAPLAQVSLRGGFILKASGAYDGQLTTGKAAWQVARLAQTRMTDRNNDGGFGVGSQCEVTGTCFLDERPDDSAFADAVVVRKPVKTVVGISMPGWPLYPTVLRDMMFARKTPGRVKRGDDLLKPGAIVPAGTRCRALWDLGDYYCAYPFMRTKGGRGATVRWGWTECLRDAKGNKGDRASCEGVDFTRGMVDTFRPDGRDGAVFSTPWWRAGRWCLLEVETADEPLVIKRVELAETRYPVRLEARFACDDPFVTALQGPCARSLKMCMHEMFFDCPYYEQQMYPGDGRLHFLTAGLFDLEDRLVRHAITLYDYDRRENGMVAMNCPTRGTQDGFGFAECELFMYRDYLMNHANRSWLEARLPGMNHTLMGFDQYLRDDGLLGETPGWNFVDWVPSWDYGVPPDGAGPRPNAEINLQYLNALQSAAACEAAVGHRHLAAHWTERAEGLKAAIRRTFWCPERSLFASSVAKRNFSEHAQSLALLCDVVTGEEAKACFKALVETPNLDRGTIYYKHYLFETFFKFGRGDLFFKNLGFWRDCVNWHLSTILETPETNSRSDCHGWGAHPLWHLHTGVAGVRSAAPFYERVLVAPNPAHLKFIRSSTPTPKGPVELDLRFENGGVSGKVTLPTGLSGDFKWNGVLRPLSPGENAVQLFTTQQGERTVQ